MKSHIRRLLREGIINTKSYKLLTERERRVSLNRLSLILEKEIRVGNTLTKKLEAIASPLSKKILNFLKGNNIKDGANVKYVDYNKDNEKLLTLGYEDREGKIRERLFKLNKLIKYLGGNLSDVKPYEVEDLISFFKKADTSQLKLVDGVDILNAYHCKNYDEGETMGSCMRYEEAQKYLDIYVDNPDSVKCLVLLNPENGKVRGRALIWYMDGGATFMDRIYTTNKEYETYFKSYAEEKNMSTYGRTPSDDVTLENDGEYDYYPYMDTFKYYTPDTGVLSNDSGELELGGTDGYASDPGLWSDYHQGYIPEDEAYYVESEDGYFHADDVEVTWDDQIVFRESDNVIVLDAGEAEAKYSLKDDAVEDYNGDWIKSEEAYELDAGEHKYEYALVDETIGDYNGDVILDSEAIELTNGQYAGDYCLKSEAWGIIDDIDIIPKTNDYSDLRKYMKKYGYNYDALVKFKNELSDQLEALPEEEYFKRSIIRDLLIKAVKIIVQFQSNKKNYDDIIHEDDVEDFKDKNPINLNDNQFN